MPVELLKMKNRHPGKLIVILSVLFIFSVVLFKLTRSRNIGRHFNARYDSGYVKDNLWSYNGGFKIGQGDFLEFRMDTTVFSLRRDTIFYNSKPKARVTKLNRRLFQMEIESIETGEKGTYLNIEEPLQ